MMNTKMCNVFEWPKEFFTRLNNNDERFKHNTANWAIYPDDILKRNDAVEYTVDDHRKHVCTEYKNNPSNFKPNKVIVGLNPVIKDPTYKMEYLENLVGSENHRYRQNRAIRAICRDNPDQFHGCYLTDLLKDQTGKKPEFPDDAGLKKYLDIFFDEIAGFCNDDYVIWIMGMGLKRYKQVLEAYNLSFSSVNVDCGYTFKNGKRKTKNKCIYKFNGKLKNCGKYSKSRCFNITMFIVDFPGGDNRDFWCFHDEMKATFN